uniref:RNA-binding protein 7 n=1 Tax=Tanacetum cinerariifolium TaxID=118510 RepID=A0A6L2NA42_TANCI|nr:RNA-binding protein 7 [Tanacetum cinerariifolium]
MLSLFGNLDERVTDRVLYDILIQAGRVIDLHIPRDRETDKPKGFAFAEYETEEIADYAVKLFTGLVTLYDRTLRFGISGQDKANASSMVTPNSSFRSRFHEDVSASPSSRYAHVSSRTNVDHNIHDYRRGFGTTGDGITHSRSSRYDMINPKRYAPY